MGIQISGSVSGYLIVLLCLLSVVLVQAAGAQAATNIFVNPVHTDANPGDSFSASIDINSDDDIYAVQLYMSFDPSMLQASISEGGFLSKDGASTFCMPLQANNTLGKISYACTRFSTASAVTGTGTLLGIGFNATGFGTSSLDIFNVIVSDEHLGHVPATITNGTARVNQAPSAGSLVLSPASPATTDSLTGTYSYSDPEGDAESGTQISWYKDSAIQAAYNDILSVPSGATSKGESWHFTVTPSDGIAYGNTETSAAVTIGNTPPTQPAVDVTPDSPLTGDDLICAPSGSTDADGDGISYSYSWHKDGVLQPAQTASTVSFSLTSKGEVWKCVATPNDGEDDGPAGEDQVIIQNAAPAIDSFTPLATLLQTREGYSLLFNHTSSDPDGDTLTYSWELDALAIAATQSWLFGPTTSDCGSSTVSLTVGDSLLTDSQSWTVNIGLSGDVDDDYDVDIFDLAAVGLSYGSVPGDPSWNADSDINPGPQTDGTPEGNGIINIFDLAAVGLNYGNAC